MVNSIPSYYNVKLYLKDNILDNNGPKWPIYVMQNYDTKKWPSVIYEMIDKYTDSFGNDIIVLINKNTHEPYSSAKSARK